MISGNHDSMVSLSNDHCFELYEAHTLAASEGSGAGMQDPVIVRQNLSAEREGSVAL